MTGLLFLFSCIKNKNPYMPENQIVKSPYSIAKWYDNHTAAITLTYDHGKPNAPRNKRIHKLLIENGLSMDYELVTSLYDEYPDRLSFLVDSLITKGFGYFGHGHYHLNHDTCTYQEAYDNMKICYDKMVAWGLKTAAYAYPHGAGHETTSQQALQAAGFLAGRMHFDKIGGYQGMTNPYICPVGQTEPSNWCQLPTLVMQDYEVNQCEKCVNNNEQLIPYLDSTIAKTAWIILTYHNIGYEIGYGYTKWEEFEKNVITIKQYDFWNAPMNNIILYIYERNHATVNIEYDKETDSIEILLKDALPNDFFDQSLTLLFEVPDHWIGKKIGIFQESALIEEISFTEVNAKVSLLPNEIKKILKPVFK